LILDISILILDISILILILDISILILILDISILILDISILILILDISWMLVYTVYKGSSPLPDGYDITYKVQEQKHVTGGISTLVGTNEGSLVMNYFHYCCRYLVPIHFLSICGLRWRGAKNRKNKVPNPN